MVWKASFTKGFYIVRYKKVFMYLPKLVNLQTHFQSNVSQPAGTSHACIHQACGKISSAQYNLNLSLTILVKNLSVLINFII